MKNVDHLNSLLNSVGKSASETTRNLSLFGDGNMGKGIQNLYEAGKRSGMIKGSTITAGAFSFGIVVYKLTNYIKDNYVKNVTSSENCLKTEISDGAITIDNSPVNTAESIEPQTKNTV